MSLNQITQLTAASLIAIMSFVQIVPIKINPWSYLARAMGRALNREVIDKVEQTQRSLEKHIEAEAERDAKECRLRILRFNDEIIRKEKHTQEHFNDILDDITAYERYCDEHPKYENNKAVLAIENIKRIYRRCEAENSFLIGN